MALVYAAVATAALIVALACFALLRGRVATPADGGAYAGLRTQALELDPSRIGIDVSVLEGGVFGAVLEIGLGGDCVTVACFADGSASLYGSGGGGVIGAGGVDAVRRAALAFVASAARHRDRLTASDDTPAPESGTWQVFALTPAGRLVGRASQGHLGTGAHPLDELFRAGDEVVTQIRQSAAGSALGG